MNGIGKNKNGVTLALLVLLCVAMFFIGRWFESRSHNHSSEEIVEIYEEETEVPDLAPVPRDSVVIRYVEIEVPVEPEQPSAPIDSLIIPKEEISVVVKGDSAEVKIPISQKVYETEDYRAYISGYRAQMDSIFIVQRTTTVKVREPTKQKRFSVGVQAGYGFTPKGFQPYIGVGVSVKLFDF